jgi:hypothetical protein
MRWRAERQRLPRLTRKQNRGRVFRCRRPSLCVWTGANTAHRACEGTGHHRPPLDGERRRAQDSTASAPHQSRFAGRIWPIRCAARCVSRLRRRIGEKSVRKDCHADHHQFRNHVSVQNNSIAALGITCVTDCSTTKSVSSISQRCPSTAASLASTSCSLYRQHEKEKNAVNSKTTETCVPCCLHAPPTPFLSPMPLCMCSCSLAAVDTAGGKPHCRSRDEQTHQPSLLHLQTQRCGQY